MQRDPIVHQLNPRQARLFMKDVMMSNLSLVLLVLGYLTLELDDGIVNMLDILALDMIMPLLLLIVETYELVDKVVLGILILGELSLDLVDL